MINKCSAINRFYRSAAWQQARLIKITSANGRCEKCGGVGEEVHHIVHIDHNNVNDVDVTLKIDNLILLCKHCHNDAHKRFIVNKATFDKNGNLIKK
ncbi:MAG: HNH endonuclease signature motif containing protein [Bacilli bacterium]|nr:HNH endonuclease signature motif containing protein [Bacilli bacterium]